MFTQLKKKQCFCNKNVFLHILIAAVIEILTLVFVRWWVGPNMGVSWAVATSGGSPPSNPFKIQDHAPHQFQIFFNNPPLFQILLINPDPAPTPKIHLQIAPSKPLYFTAPSHWRAIKLAAKSQAVANFSPNLSPKPTNQGEGWPQTKFGHLSCVCLLQASLSSTTWTIGWLSKHWQGFWALIIMIDLPFD